MTKIIRIYPRVGAIYYAPTVVGPRWSVKLEGMTENGLLNDFGFFYVDPHGIVTYGTWKVAAQVRGRSLGVQQRQGETILRHRKRREGTEMFYVDDPSGHNVLYDKSAAVETFGRKTVNTWMANPANWVRMPRGD